MSAATDIHSYSATFQTGQLDSVTTPDCDATSWWRALNDWSGPSGRRPLLGSLAQSGIVLLAASPAHLSVLEEEVMSLDPDRVLVISAGALASQVPNHQLPAFGRAQLCFGGSLVAINTRIAHFLIETLGSSVNRKSATAALQRLLAAAPKLPQHNRRRLDDEQVIDSILRIRVQHPLISATGAHRLFRDEGFACEQQRFKAHFGEALRRSRRYSPDEPCTRVDWRPNALLCPALACVSEFHSVASGFAPRFGSFLAGLAQW